MPITAFYANVSCSDLARSTRWFATLLGREPDAHPMEGLAEWHLGRTAGLQLYQAPEHAGHSTLTLIVDDIEAERRRLVGAGLDPGAVEAADHVAILRLSDPDANLVVLAAANPR